MDNKEVLLKPELERISEDINYNDIKYLYLSDEIINFIKVLKDNFSDSDLTNFYNNISYLDVIIDDPFGEYKNSYDPVNNLIYLESDKAESSIYHELFHAASTCYKDDNVYCGFAQWNDKIKIGVGLTEGYTQLLRERYFGEEEFKHGYAEEVKIVNLLELIVGKKQMGKLYLNSDLKGLINELSNYNSIEEIMNFIYSLDYIIDYNFIDSNDKDNNVFENLVKSYRNIKEFLLSSYSKKYMDELNTKLQENKQDELIQLTLFLYNFINELMEDNIIVSNITGEEFEILSTDFVNNTLAEATGISEMKFFK